ncbi:endoplasmic reticulum protein [Epithele typhae]|uniref:endoplasmic reticulum protein n=1 Tax=Epithele typhae TaxID=378194 RepID=UPI0020073C53|nr:endoplasmic reticulum protein [Epithele typhae]KAH9921948.1 endoplasmic reticulum protein [Epithele typhae]
MLDRRAITRKRTPAGAAPSSGSGRGPRSACQTSWVRTTLSLEMADGLAPVVDFDTVKARTLEPSPDSYLVDVREPDEVIQGSIPSSVNIPLTVFSNALQMDPEAFKQQFGFEKPRKDQEVTFYCRSGKRSTTASDLAMKAGYAKSFNYTGSWLEWVEKEKQGSA